MDKNKFKLTDATDAKQGVVNRIAAGWFDHNSIDVDTSNSCTLTGRDFIKQFTTVDTAGSITVPFDSSTTGDDNPWSGKAFIINVTDTASSMAINVNSVAITTISNGGTELLVNDGADTAAYGWINITLQ